MQYEIAKRGWVLLNPQGKVVAEGNKFEVMKVVAEKLIAGHSVKGLEQPAEAEESD